MGRSDMSLTDREGRVTHEEYVQLVDQYGAESVKAALNSFIDMSVMKKNDFRVFKGSNVVGEVANAFGGRGIDVTRKKPGHTRNHVREHLPDNIDLLLIPVAEGGLLETTQAKSRWDDLFTENPTYALLAQQTALIEGGFEGSAAEAQVSARAATQRKPFDPKGTEVLVRKATQRNRAQLVGLSQSNAGASTSSGGGSLFSPVHLGRRQLSEGTL
jgi:hypothetical protein